MLPDGVIPLWRIEREQNLGNKIQNLGSLLAYLLKQINPTFARTDGKPPTLGERVEENKILFSNFKNVFFAVGVRNYFAHPEDADRAYSDDEKIRAADHMIKAIREVIQHPNISTDIKKDILLDPYAEAERLKQERERQEREKQQEQIRRESHQRELESERQAQRERENRLADRESQIRQQELNIENEQKRIQASRKRAINAFLIIVLLVVVAGGIFLRLSRARNSPFSSPISSSFSSSSSSSSANYSKTYRGRIGGKYDIEMNLQRNGNELNGSYFYTKYRKSISLRGQVEDNQSFVLNGYEANGNHIDIFRGRFLSDNRIQGAWSKPNDSKSMSFSVSATN